MISPVNPIPFNSGGKVRIYYTFKELSKYHNVKLLVPATTGEIDIGNKLNNVKIIKIKNFSKFFFSFSSIFSTKPYHHHLWSHKEFEKEVSKELLENEYSLIYCHFFYTFHYVKNSNIPIIIDAHNIDHDYWKNKTKNFFEKKKIFLGFFSFINEIKVNNYEKKIIPKTKKIIEVSYEDSLLLRDKYKIDESKIAIVPNGVDINSFVFKDHSFSNDKTSVINLGFLGSLDLALNQEGVIFLCKEILPKLEEKYTEKKFRVLVIGKSPPKFLTDISNDRPNQIFFTGTVESIPPYLNKVNILLLPLFHGAGTKLRIFEAMASGVACVGTGLAFNGIDEIIDYENALIADSVNEFIEKIKFLFNQENYRKLASEAHRITTENYCWEKIGRKLDLVIKSSIKEPIN